MTMVSKQVIVMRKDLNMRKGKMIAQGAHASMKVLLDNMSDLYPAPGVKQKSLYYDVYNDSSSWNDFYNWLFLRLNIKVNKLEINGISRHTIGTKEQVKKLFITLNELNLPKLDRKWKKIEKLFCV